MNFLFVVQEMVFVQIDLKNVMIYFWDGDFFQNFFEVIIGEGNFLWIEVCNIEYMFDCGVLDEVCEGDEIFVEVSFDFIWEYFKGDFGLVVFMIEDVLNQIGEVIDWVFLDVDFCCFYVVDIVVCYVLNCGGGDEEQIMLVDFCWELLDYDFCNGMIVVSGKCNIKCVIVVCNMQFLGS